MWHWRNCGSKLPSNSCHGNEDIFLTEDDVSEDEKEANSEVIVKDVPTPQ